MAVASLLARAKMNSLGLPSLVHVTDAISASLPDRSVHKESAYSAPRSFVDHRANEYRPGVQAARDGIRYHGRGSQSLSGQLELESEAGQIVVHGGDVTEESAREGDPRAVQVAHPVVPPRIVYRTMR